MFEITPTMKQIVEAGSYLAINIILLAFYASVPEAKDSDIDSYRGLSIAGNVFMMIGYLLIIALHFKYNYYGALGIIVILNFGMFLLLIGMGIGAKQFDVGNYNVAIAFWFIQFAIDILGMQVIFKVYKDKSEKEEPKDSKQNSSANNAAQPQIQV